MAENDERAVGKDARGVPSKTQLARDRLNSRNGLGLVAAEAWEVEKALAPMKEDSGVQQDLATKKQRAMTPEELIKENVFSPRVQEEVGDLNRRLNRLDADLQAKPNDERLKTRIRSLRERLRLLTTLETESKGAPVPGHGRINTRAAIQIVDKDGNLVVVERGRWRPGMHAEEDAIVKLRARLRVVDVPEGSRLMVAGNQVACTKTCRPALTHFAEDYGIERVDAHVEVRPKKTGPGEASGKTTERTKLMADSPPSYVSSDTIYERKPASKQSPGGRAISRESNGTLEGKPSATTKSIANAGTTTTSTSPRVPQKESLPPRQSVIPKSTIKPSMPDQISSPPSTSTTRRPGFVGGAALVARSLAVAVANLAVAMLLNWAVSRLKEYLEDKAIRTGFRRIEPAIRATLEAKATEAVKLRGRYWKQCIYAVVRARINYFNPGWVPFVSPSAQPPETMLDFVDPVTLVSVEPSLNRVESTVRESTDLTLTGYYREFIYYTYSVPWIRLTDSASLELEDIRHRLQELWKDTSGSAITAGIQWSSQDLSLIDEGLNRWLPAAQDALAKHSPAVALGCLSLGLKLLRQGFAPALSTPTDWGLEIPTELMRIEWTIRALKEPPSDACL